MKILFCPKCKKSIQHNDKYCSHCGQSFENNKVLCATITPTVVKKRNIFNGVVKIIFALIFCAIGAALFNTMLYVVAFVIGAVLGIYGGNDIAGKRTGHCPHCQNLIEINTAQRKFRCPKCRNKVRQYKNFFNSSPILVDYSAAEIKKDNNNDIVNSAYSQNTDNNDFKYNWFQTCVKGIYFPNFNYFSTRLYNIRKVLTLTQTVAAQRIGISTSTLSSYENSNTKPNDKICSAIASAYNVPLQFLKYGYTEDFYQTFNLCNKFGEEQYIREIYFAVRDASDFLAEMLTEEEKNICRYVNETLNMRLDLFNEKAKAREYAVKAIKEEIYCKIKEQEQIQSKLCSSYGENKNLAYDAVNQLCEEGRISKEKSGNSYILRFINTEEG